jgi:hypothetical protein
VQCSDNDHQSASSIQDNHHPVLLSLLAEELNVKPDEIHDFELWVPNSLSMEKSWTVRKQASL